MDSKIPYSRWEGQSGMGAFTLNAEGITREEIRYQKFVRRLRTVFAELITKPFYLQMCLDFPDLATDYKFGNGLGITFNNDNVFEEMKQNELESKRIASFTAKKGIMKDDGTPYFSTEYLIRKELRLTADEINSNKHWIDASKAAEEKAAASEAAAPAGGASAAAPAATAEQPAAGAETIEGGETKGAGAL
jgi:hypothetical protein